jgi:catalase
VEFSKDYYGHCKPILLVDGGRALFAKLGFPTDIGVDAAHDPALLECDESDCDFGLSSFAEALLQHRNFVPETDAPRV